MLSKWQQQQAEEERRERHEARLFNLGLFCSISNVFAYIFFDAIGLPFWFHHPGYLMVRLSPLFLCFCILVGQGLHYLVHGPAQTEEEKEEEHTLWWTSVYLGIEGSMFLGHLIWGFPYWSAGIERLLG